jgi:hypothetical protein
MQKPDTKTTPRGETSSAEVKALIDSLTPKQVRAAYADLQFRTYGDRRRIETLRDGLTIWLCRYPNDLTRVKGLAN